MSMSKFPTIMFHTHFDLFAVIDFLHHKSDVLYRKAYVIVLRSETSSQTFVDIFMVFC